MFTPKDGAGGHASPDYEKVINHACREFGITRSDIAKRFKITVNLITSEHIRQLWREYLADKSWRKP